MIILRRCPFCDSNRYNPPNLSLNFLRSFENQNREKCTFVRSGPELLVLLKSYFLWIHCDLQLFWKAIQRNSQPKFGTHWKFQSDMDATRWAAIVQCCHWSDSATFKPLATGWFSKLQSIAEFYLLNLDWIQPITRPECFIIFADPDNEAFVFLLM